MSETAAGRSKRDGALPGQAEAGQAQDDVSPEPEPGHGPAAAGCGPVRAMWGDVADTLAEDAPLPALLLASSRILSAFYAGTVARAGLRISPAGLGVLGVLVTADGLKSSDVAARGWSSPGTVTAVVDTLEREGYVERRSDADDRRVVRLYVTGKGRRICADYYALAGPSWRDAFDFMSPADEPVIRRFFIDMIKQFGEMVRRERGR
ncbi:MAG: MarR family transcriptional regulator [Streptosporangiaceae bacterium]